MDTRRCLKIADRMNALLLQELAHGVDGLRMVAEPLYARDVLLVCDALPGTELAELAQHFRAAATETAQPDATPPSVKAAGPRQQVRHRSHGHAPEPARSGSGHGANPKPKPSENANADTGAAASSGFGTSVWSRIASGFGFTNPGGSYLSDSQPDTGPGAPRGAAAPPRRRWFAPPRRSAGK